MYCGFTWPGYDGGWVQCIADKSEAFLDPYVNHLLCFLGPAHNELSRLGCESNATTLYNNNKLRASDLSIRQVRWQPGNQLDQGGDKETIACGEKCSQVYVHTCEVGVITDNKCHCETWRSSDPRLVWWVQARTEHRVSIKYFVDDPGDILSQAIYRWPGLTDGVWVRDIADQSEASLDPLREHRPRVYVHIISINLIISRDNRTDDALNLSLVHWHSLPPRYRAWVFSCCQAHDQNSSQIIRHCFLICVMIMIAMPAPDKPDIAWWAHFSWCMSEYWLQVQIFYLLVLNGKSFFQKICLIEASISPPQVQIKLLAFQVEN